MLAETNVDENAPKDRFHFVYLILVLHGIGTLLPWNMFITARSYFVDYKMSKNSTEEESHYATYFLSYVGLASQIPNLMFSWINVFINIKGSVTPRIVCSILIEIIIFIITIILAITNTNKILKLFFWSTIGSIVILNMANGIYQNTIFGIAANLPFKYPAAVILGCNVSGTIVSLVNLLSMATAPNVRTAAIFYFTTALFFLLTCLITYFLLSRIKFYRYYQHLRINSDAESRFVSERQKIPYWHIFKKAFVQLFNLFFIFLVTLSIFPSVQSEIRKSNSHFIIPDKYYENIMCFLTFNVAAVLGSLCSNWMNWPGSKHLYIFVILRVFFIPFFIFCNFQPSSRTRKISVFFPNDWLYWMSGLLFGFTSGYFSAKAILYTIRSVESPYASVSAMFGGAIIITGIFFGVLLSAVFPDVVS